MSEDEVPMLPALIDLLAVVIGFDQSELIIPDDVLATVQAWRDEGIPVADLVTVMVRELNRPENAEHLGQVLAEAARLAEDQP
jgi:hypothetical protein